MLRQPVLIHFIVRHGLFDLGPKAVGVVVLKKVGQLMDDHIVNDCSRGEEETCGQIDIATSRTAAPIGSVVFERHALDVGQVIKLRVDLMDPSQNVRIKIFGDHSA